MLPVIKTISKNITILLIAWLWVGQPIIGIGAQRGQFGEVTASRLYMRTHPRRSAPPVKILSRKNYVRITETQPNWLKIVHEGEKGFVYRKYIKLIKIKAATAALISESSPQKAGQISDALDKKQKEAAAFTQQETRLVESLDQIDATLNELEKKTAILEKELVNIASALKKNETTAKALVQEIADLEAYASQRLVSLYKLSRLGTMALMASAESLFELLARKKSLQALLAHDESTWQRLARKKAELTTLQKILVKQKQARMTQALAVEKQNEALSHRRAGREKLLLEIKGKKSLTFAIIAALQKAAHALDQKIKTEALIASASPNTLSFHAFKGLLNMPVSGTIIASFGHYQSPRLNVAGFRSGIDIKAERGEPIQAVEGGKTLYAGWFKGYGNMLILDHGDSYCTVYAHAHELFKQQGETVISGEVIATVGDTGSLQGPKLHFEIRHHGKPVDPLKWIGKRSRNDYGKEAKR